MLRGAYGVVSCDVQALKVAVALCATTLMRCVLIRHGYIARCMG